MDEQLTTEEINGHFSAMDDSVSLIDETENNIVTINGQEYSEDTLDERQKYFINQIRDLQLKANSLRFQLDQVVVAQDRFTEELVKTVEEELEAPQVGLN